MHRTDFRGGQGGQSACLSYTQRVELCLTQRLGSDIPMQVSSIVKISPVHLQYCP